MVELLNFIKEVDKLKNIERATLVYEGNRRENSAEHSWHLALTTLVLASQSERNLDILKCLKMAMIHDLVEIDAGDIIVYAEDKNKFERELKAAKRIFSLLPKSLEEEFLKLWIEFEKKESEEAKFVAGIDRFLPLYSNLLNEGYTWKKFDITKEMVTKKNGHQIEYTSPSIWKYVEKELPKLFK